MTLLGWTALIVSILLGIGSTLAATERGRPSGPSVPDTVIVIGAPQLPAVTTTPSTTSYTGPSSPSGVTLTDYVLTYTPPSSGGGSGPVITVPPEDPAEVVGPSPAGSQSGFSLALGAGFFLLGGFILGGTGRKERASDSSESEDDEPLVPAGYTIKGGEV